MKPAQKMAFLKLIFGTGFIHIGKRCELIDLEYVLFLFRHFATSLPATLWPNSLILKRNKSLKMVKNTAKWPIWHPALNFLRKSYEILYNLFLFQFETISGKLNSFSLNGTKTYVRDKHARIHMT